MRKALCIMMVAAAGSVASADVLWDQSALNWAADGFYNSISGAPPFGSTAYAMNDITVPAGGWTVDSVSVYFSRILSSWDTEITEGRLYVQSKTSSIPTVLPGGGLIPMSAVGLFDDSVQQSYYEVTASGLNLNLAPGDYWIGITPVAPGGPFGPELGLSAASSVGDVTTVWYAGFGGGFIQHSADAAMKVQGVPAPAGVAVAGLAGLFAARRRRA